MLHINSPVPTSLPVKLKYHRRQDGALGPAQLGPPVPVQKKLGERRAPKQSENQGLSLGPAGAQSVLRTSACHQDSCVPWSLWHQRPTLRHRSAKVSIWGQVDQENMAQAECSVPHASERGPLCSVTLGGCTDRCARWAEPAGVNATQPHLLLRVEDLSRVGGGGWGGLCFPEARGVPDGERGHADPQAQSSAESRAGAPEP